MARVLVYPLCFAGRLLTAYAISEGSDQTAEQSDLSLRWSHVLLSVLSCTGSYGISLGKKVFVAWVLFYLRYVLPMLENFDL